MFSFCLSPGLSLILMIIAAWMVINQQLDVGAIVAVLNLSLRFFKQVQNVASHIMPVSYTHLDVYKRQEYVRLGERFVYGDCKNTFVVTKILGIDLIEVTSLLSGQRCV